MISVQCCLCAASVNQELKTKGTKTMKPLNVTNFYQTIRDTNESGRMAFVDFWSPSCRPCRALTPTILKIEESYKDDFDFFSVDLSDIENGEIANIYCVESLPTMLVLVDNGHVVSALGVSTQDEIEETLDDIIENME